MVRTPEVVAVEVASQLFSSRELLSDGLTSPLLTWMVVYFAVLKKMHGRALFSEGLPLDSSSKVRTFMFIFLEGFLYLFP
jgi:hypothetical protein